MNDRVFHILGYDVIRRRLAECAVSQNGREACLAVYPETSRKKIDKMLVETREAESLLVASSNAPLISFDDTASEAARLRSGASLSCAELLRVMRLMKAAKHASRNIKTDEEKNIAKLPEICEGLFYDDSLITSIERSIINEEEVSDDASSELRLIRRRIKSENDAIRDKLTSILRSGEHAKHLQDDIVTMRNGRYVVPVKQEFRGQIKGLVHGQSSSGATLFIEPMSVVESNNKLKVLEEEEQREIERILMRLADELRPYTQQFIWNTEILTELDVIFAKASLSVKMKAFPPLVSEDRSIRIIKGRHPLIDPKTVIPVSFEMSDGKNAFIITGPNTGGKTATLKLVGLFALMMQSGMFLPAVQGTSLPVFSDVFADIGDEQSIEQSLSTFSSHMRNIIEIAENAESESLVLLDEPGAGTDPEEGAALAMAILRELALRGCSLFATTHYSEIKAFALTGDQFLNASMEFDADTLSPTYKLVTGVAGTSNALLISSRLGLPGSIIESARKFMREERLRFDDLLLQAERSKMQAIKELEHAKELERKAEETMHAAEKLEEEVAAKRAELIEKAKEQASEIVKKAREETEEIIKDMKKLGYMSQPEATKAIEKARNQLKEKKDALDKKLVNISRQSKLVDPAKLVLGDNVRVISMDAKATVEKLPDRKGNVGIRAGIMSLNIHYSDLELITEKKPSSKEVRRTQRIELQRKNIGMSINLTGKTVEEAIIELDQYFDDAFVSGLTEVTVIHGVGTGALRSGIHNYLRRHPHVAEYRLGKYGEGEAGVTIVKLK